jgi:LysM repeat protein
MGFESQCSLDVQVENSYEKSKSKRIQRAFLVSLILNVLLVAACFIEWHEAGYMLLSKSSFCPKKQVTLAAIEVPPTLEAGLLTMKEKNKEELLDLLQDTHVVSQGYQMRDLALATLVSCHHFDLLRILQGNLAPKEERKCSIKGGTFSLYPGLSEEHFLSIGRFVKSERFPYTPEGLFLALLQNRESVGLKEAFTLTPHYLALDTLFSRTCTIKKEELFDLILSENFALLDSWLVCQKEHPDFSKEATRKLLLQYLALSSKPAAEILVQYDRPFAKDKLTDAQVMVLLGLLDSKPELAREFALDLLESSRASTVYKFAHQTLVKCSEKEGALLAKLSRKELLSHFGKKVPKEELAKGREAKPQVAVASNKKAALPQKVQTVARVEKDQARTYVVQNGDNLWRISKKFQVKIDQIMLANNLSSEALKPGSVLRIPY